MHRWISLVLVLLAMASAAWAEPPKVVNLKPLLDCEYWILDITYHAQDQREDRDYTAGLEMTATARYNLKRVDRSEAYGHWQAQKCESHNLSYRGFRYNRHHAPDRLDYAAKGGGEMLAPLADLHIGGFTPGYALLVSGGFPAQLTSGSAGAQDHPLVLNTQVQGAPGLTGMLMGPLPNQGTTISGSKTIPAEIPPFLINQLGQVQMSIQFVLKPDPRLAPLGP
jgi:hypothetical protein